MSKIKLSSYLNKVESKYILAREEWEKIQKEIKEENEKYNNNKWQNYTQKGIEDIQIGHFKKLKELSEKMDQVRSKFENAVSEIMKDSDKVFNKVYQYTPTDVDINGVAILNNGLMGTNELIDLAESYRKSGNMTMYFMVADKLKPDKVSDKMDESDWKAYSYYTNSRQARQRNDHECIEGFRDICLKALRDEDYLSNGVHKMHDEFYQKYMDYSEGIETEVESPWD